MADTGSRGFHRLWLIFALIAAFALARLCATPVLAQSPEATLYHYRAVVTDVHDGDTVTVDIDLGFHVWVRGEHIRFAGIDAPELHGDTKVQGEASRDFLRDLVLNKQVIIETIKAPDGGDKQEKYGRYLGVIWLEGTNVNELLVTRGYAVHRQY